MIWLKNIYSKVMDKIDNVDIGFVAFITAAITSIVTYLAYKFGDPNLQEMSNRGLKLSSFITFVVYLIHFSGTRKVDVMKEIMEEHNTALAIVLSAIILGAAGCILL